MNVIPIKSICDHIPAVKMSLIWFLLIYIVIKAEKSAYTLCIDDSGSFKNRTFQINCKLTVKEGKVV